MPLLDALSSVIAPHNCLGCGAEGKLICQWCKQDKMLPLPSRCYRCHALSRNFAVCDRCRHKTDLRQVWIRTAYESVAKELIHGFKYENKYASAKVIAQSLAEVMPIFSADTLFVPVPTATARRRERGYDHTGLIVKELAKLLDINYAQPAVRLNQSHQVGANRLQRFKQLQDAFYITKPQIIEGVHIVLVDDIVTTGATLEAMAKMLKNAGAYRTDAIVFAQKH